MKTLLALVLVLAVSPALAQTPPPGQAGRTSAGATFSIPPGWSQHNLPSVIVLDAPDTVKPGQTFKVKWKGPNGPSDYITIVLASAEAGEYGDYFFTQDANPGFLTAPSKQGDYEIRYQSDRVGNFVFGYVAITVKK